MYIMLFSKLSPRLSFPQKDASENRKISGKQHKSIFSQSVQVALRCFVLDRVTEMQLNVTLLNTLSGGLSLNEAA